MGMGRRYGCSCGMRVSVQDGEYIICDECGGILKNLISESSSTKSSDLEYSEKNSKFKGKMSPVWY
jgi:hypothetical protein